MEEIVCRIKREGFYGNLVYMVNRDFKTMVFE